MKARKISILAILFIFLTSCAPDYTKILREPEKKFYSGQPVEAARTFIPHINKSGKDQLLFMMEAGAMLHTAENYEKSIQVFTGAAKIAAVSKTSITRQAGSLLTNERSTTYNGEDFERVLIYMYQGINYLMIKDPDNARVEFKRVNDELTRISKETGRDYKQNIMAKYLTAVSYEMMGDEDNNAEDWEFAYIEYKQIYQLQPGLDMVYGDLQRVSKKLKYMDDYNEWRGKFGVRDNIPGDSGEVVVIYQAGQSAIKQSRGKLMSDQNMANAVRISIQNMPMKAGVTASALLIALNKAENPIPVFRKRSNQISRLDLVVNNRRLGSTILLEDIENTAVNNLKDDYNRLYKKVAAGIVTKVAVSLAAGYAAKKVAQSSNNNYIKAASGCIGMAAGAGTGAALISQIQPDLRCWHSLPANLQLDRMFLSPGKYTVTLNFLGQNGAVVRQETDEFTVEKGKRTFLNYRTLY